MRDSILKLVIASIFGAMLAVPAFADEKLVIGTEGAYPPFNFVDASGKVQGFDIEIGMALCKDMKIECEFVTQSWDGIIPALIAKKFDIILASMGITDERKAIVSFTNPYYKPALVYVTTKDSDIREFTPSSLNGKTIGAQVSTTQSKFIEDMFPQSELKFYETQDEVNLDLVGKRLDLQVSDLLPMKEWVEKSTDGTCCEIRGEIITDPKFVGDGIGIALRKEDSKLRERINQAIQNIRVNGEYKKINDRYFDIDIFTMK